MEKKSRRRVTRERAWSNRLEVLANQAVTTPVGKTYSANTAIVICLNMTLGSGPLTLPYAMAKSGILVSALFLALAAFAAYITNTYIIETLMLSNAALFEVEALQRSIDADRLAEHYSRICKAADSNMETAPSSSSESCRRRRPLAHMMSQELKPLETNRSEISADNFGMERAPSASSDMEVTCTTKSSFRRLRPDQVYKLRERIEIGEMGHRVLPAQLHITLDLMVLTYTFGVLCVYAVALLKSMMFVASLTGLGDLDRGPCVAVMTCVFLPLCFADMQKLKSMQWIVIGARIIAIVVMIAGAAYEAYTMTPEKAEEREQRAANSKAWVSNGIPLADVEGLTGLVANGALAFMVHHSLPGLVSPLEDLTDAPRVIATSYVVSFLVYLVLGCTALAAFGSEVPPLYNFAFGDLTIHGYPVISWLPIDVLLCGYPLMLLAVFPVVGITFRNNLLGLLRLPPFGSREGWKLSDIIATATAALPPAAVAYLTDDVQSIVSVFAGIIGTTLLLLIPCVLLLFTRKRIPAATEDFPLRSSWGSKPVFVFLIAFWAGIFGFNIYRFVC